MIWAILVGKPNMKWVLALTAALAMAAPTPAQIVPEEGMAWRFQLIEGAAIMDDCPVCDRLSFWQELKGTFDLVGGPAGGALTVTNIHFFSDYSEKPEYQVSGHGTLSFAGSEPSLALTMAVLRAGVLESVELTNAPPESARILPIVSAQADESPGSLTRVYRLRLIAAPIRALWFSTTSSFTSGPSAPPEEAVSHGDLLSSNGRVVKRNRELAERLSIPDGDVGLDAVDVGPRGEVFYSTTSTAESPVNGTIGHGDLATSAGRVYLQSPQLLAPFGVDDPEAGLDALHIFADDEFYFSISKQAARATGGVLRRGDILSSKGKIIRTEANLLVRFLSPLVESVGVDALHRWPSGELWFSTETGFTAGGVTVEPGDVISDQGYVAIRNRDLMAAFAPLERLADFGLDAMTIISDAAAAGTPAQLGELLVGEGTIELGWEGSGRVFQVERARTVEGPYIPITDLTLERTAVDHSTGPAGFYRVRQW